MSRTGVWMNTNTPRYSKVTTVLLSGVPSPLSLHHLPPGGTSEGDSESAVHRREPQDGDGGEQATTCKYNLNFYTMHINTLNTLHNTHQYTEHFTQCTSIH